MATEAPSDSPLLDSPSPPPLPPAPPPPLPADLSTLLSRLPPPGHPPLLPRSQTQPQPRQTREQSDERCWIFTNQSNARRALGLEPQMSMYCYINFRNSLSSLTPVPGHPNAFLAKDAPQTITLNSKTDKEEKRGEGPGLLKKTVLESMRFGDREVELPNYWWKALDGRYWYHAKGKKAIERHFEEMGDLAKLEKKEDEKGETSKVNAWGMIKRIERRVQEKKEEDALPGKREERQVRKALGVVDLNQNSESLTSLSSLYSTSLQRFHAHILRIYSPGIQALSRLPQTFTDGTQKELVSLVYTRLTDGSAFVFGQTLWESLKKVTGEIKEMREAELERRRKNGGIDGNGKNGPLGGGRPPPPVDIGFGGSQPRVPPSRPSDPSSSSPTPPTPPSPSDSSTPSIPTEDTPIPRKRFFTSNEIPRPPPGANVEWPPGSRKSSDGPDEFGRDGKERQPPPKPIVSIGCAIM